MNINSSGDLWRAYTKSNIDLWDQNFVNGKYIIAYKFNPTLEQKVQNMLPKVKIFGPDFRLKYYQIINTPNRNNATMAPTFSIVALFLFGMFSYTIIN